MRSVKIQVSMSHPSRININFSEFSSSQTKVMNPQVSAVFCLSYNPDESNQDTNERAITNNTNLNPRRLTLSFGLITLRLRS